MRSSDRSVILETGQPKGPAAATKDNPFANSLGMKFVPVPITTGPTAGKVVLFSIWETRNMDYRAWQHASGKKIRSLPHDYFGQLVGDGPEHPAVCLWQEQAVAFCEWLTVTERANGRIGPDDQYRLPTDVEWSHATGVGDREDASAPPEAKDGKVKDWPWPGGRPGDWPPPRDAGNYCGQEAKGKFTFSGGTLDLEQPWIAKFYDGYVTTAPVGSFSPNKVGLFDVGGNAAEWCASRFRGDSGPWVLRGGCWLDAEEEKLLSSSRAPFTPDGDPEAHTGFRCLLECGVRPVESR